MARPRIFVQMAAYRDSETRWTIRDAFERAAWPDRVAIGVCWQYEPGADAPRVRVDVRPAQVRAVRARAGNSYGLGWARHAAEQLWEGEDYVLQIDAHMRFENAWDERLIAELERCNSRFPVLTTYPWGYVPPRQLQAGPPTRLAARRFTPNGILLLKPWAMTRPLAAPVPQAFFAGGFAFYPGRVVREVPHDPYLYFNATEPTHAVRLWTHGWDLFAPSVNLVYHLYTPDHHGKALHWDDRPEWLALAARGQARARHLLDVEESRDTRVLQDLDRFGLGRRRSLADYQRYAGVDFKRRRITAAALEGRVTPRYRTARSR